MWNYLYLFNSFVIALATDKCLAKEINYVFSKNLYLEIAAMSLQLSFNSKLSMHGKAMEQVRKKNLEKPSDFLSN